MEFTLFNSVPDPRVVGRCTYNLSELLTIGLLTFLCGGEDYVDMQEFAEPRARTFGLLSNVKTSPSCDTFERIFASVNPDALEECLREYGKKFLQVLSKQQIAIDGKCLRGVNPKLLGNKGLYLMNAFVCKNRISISQKVLNDKENEIKAIPKVLESIDIEDAVISIDAIGTQVDIVKLILKKHGHYFLAVKENQKTLYEAIRSAFGRFRYQYIAETPEKDHGRIEQRTCRILSADKLMDTSLLLRWEGIKTIIEIESVVTIGDKTSTNFRYYISDIKEDNSAYYNNLARNHWA